MHPALRRDAGFTLIELLVVISILSLLVVTFAPNVMESGREANFIADQKQLRDHFSWIHLHRQRYGHYPEGGGHEFVLECWRKGIVQHTPANLAKFFVPGQREVDDHYQALARQPLDEVWKDLAALTSADTHYAGRALQHKGSMEATAMEIWLADDNEGGWRHPDGRINILVAEGQVYALRSDVELQPFGASPDCVIEVGPGSPYLPLRKLEK